MTDVKDLVAEATEKLKTEAQSLRDQITTAEKALTEQLAPARGQLAELEAAIARIEGKPVAGSGAGSSRAPRGHNRTLILDALKAKPGMTAAQVSEATGISKPTAAATLAKLTQDGLVTKVTKPGKGVVHSLT